MDTRFDPNLKMTDIKYNVLIDVKFIAFNFRLISCKIIQIEKKQSYCRKFDEEDKYSRISNGYKWRR